MSQTRLKDFLELVGLTAIVASLIFVAIELRQSNLIGRIEAMESMASSWSSVGIELASNENLAILLSRTDNGALPKDFNAVQNRQLFNIIHGLDHHWEMRFNQLKLGLLESADYSYPEPLSSLYASAYHKEIWPKIRPGLSEAYAEFWEQRFGLDD